VTETYRSDISETQAAERRLIADGPGEPRTQ
jgi:hypothetical protein